MRTRTSRDCSACAALLRPAGSVGVALLLALLTVTGNARAATLSVANVENATAGDTAVQVPISLSNDGASAAIGGVQMDVAYEPAVLTLSIVKTGAAAQDAGKSVSFNIVSDGVVRVIVAGLNQKTIADGVLATMLFNVAAGVPADTYPVAMTVAQMVSPNGTQIIGATVPGTVTVVGATEGENTAPSGCSGGTLSPPHDSGNSGAGVLLLVSLLVIGFGAHRREQRQVPRQ